MVCVKDGPKGFGTVGGGGGWKMSSSGLGAFLLFGGILDFGENPGFARVGRSVAEFVWTHSGILLPNGGEAC